MKGEGGWLFTRYIQVECITIIYKHTWKNSTFKQSSKLKSNLKVIYRSCKHTLIQDVTQTKLNNLSPQLICALKSVKKKVRVEDIMWCGALSSLSSAHVQSPISLFMNANKKENWDDDEDYKAQKHPKICPQVFSFRCSSNCGVFGISWSSSECGAFGITWRSCSPIEKQSFVSCHSILCLWLFNRTKQVWRIRK